MRATDTQSATKEIPMAIHERIVGPLLRLLSISKRQSQWFSLPGFQPPAAAAISSSDFRRSSSEYAMPLTPEYLAACEAQAKAYYDQFHRGGLCPESVMRTDLTDTAYLIAFVVPELVAEIRRLQAPR